MLASVNAWTSQLSSPPVTRHHSPAAAADYDLPEISIPTWELGRNAVLHSVDSDTRSGLPPPPTIKKMKCMLDEEPTGDPRR